MKEDFKVQVIVYNSLATVLADTGASISVCGKAEAKTMESSFENGQNPS